MALPTGGYSLDTLFMYPYIVDRISRVGATSLAMSNFYGMGLRTVGREGQLVSGTDRSIQPQIVFDVFNNTRLTNSMRPRGTGPQTVRPQKTGQVTVNAMRFYENRLFSVDEVDKYRKLGSNRTDQIDAMGAEYVTRQMDDLIRRAVNGREFCFVNMLKGGWDVMRVGEEQFIPVPTSYTNQIAFSNTYDQPTAHTGQLPILAGGNDAIATSWDDTANADIPAQLRNIRAAAVSRSGLPITELWCNSTVFNHMLNNDAAQAVGGVNFRVFDRLTQRTVETGNPEVLNSPGSKYVMEAQLRALPEINIHVYDDGLTLPANSAGVYSPEDQVPHDPAAVSPNEVFVKYLGDTEILLTPPPETASQWLRMYAVKEVIQKNFESPFEDLYGLGAWTRRQIDPIPAYDLRVIDNYCPAMPIPTAVYNPTVVFGS